MSLTQVVVLAILQGVTELLPISSSAHLFLVPWLLGWPDQGLTFDVALHVGTLLAVVGYFWKLWWQTLVRDRRLLWFLVLATLPAAVAGVAFRGYVETTLRNPFVIAFNLVAVALLMHWADRKGRLEGHLRQVSLKDSLLVGLAQAAALVPGVSRSGITITAGLFRGMTRETAARFSFLLSTPIIAGAGLVKALELRTTGVPADMRIPFLLGMSLAAITGYAVISFFMRYLQTRTLKIFVYYRIVFGIIIFVLAILSRPR